jgi:hypothetical protein
MHHQEQSILLTNPDIAMLVIPLSGKPERGNKKIKLFSNPSLRSREGGRAKQRPGELTIIALQ